MSQSTSTAASTATSTATTTAARTAPAASTAPAAPAAPVTVPLAPAFGFAGTVGPALVIVSTLLWLGGVDELRYAVQFLGALLLAFAMVGVCALMFTRIPRTASVLAVMTAVGFGGGGSGFAIDGLHEVIHGSTSLAETGGLAPAIAPMITGLLGPLSIIAIGAAVLKTRVLPAATGVMLVAAGLAFPLSRVAEIAPLAMVVDLLLFAAVVPVGLRFWRMGRDAD